MLEHPDITRCNRTGYPNVISQPEFAGFDHFGDEIYPGDNVVEIDGDVILEDNLTRYLKECMEARFYTAS